MGKDVHLQGAESIQTGEQSINRKDEKMAEKAFNHREPRDGRIASMLGSAEIPSADSLEAQT